MENTTTKAIPTMIIETTGVAISKSSLLNSPQLRSSLNKPNNWALNSEGKSQLSLSKSKELKKLLMKRQKHSKFLANRLSNYSTMQKSNQSKRLRKK